MIGELIDKLSIGTKTIKISFWHRLGKKWRCPWCFNLAFNQIQFSEEVHHHDFFRRNPPEPKRRWRRKNYPFFLFREPSIFCWFSNLKVRWKMNEETRPGLLIKKWKKIWTVEPVTFLRLSPSSVFSIFCQPQKGAFCSRPLWLS